MTARTDSARWLLLIHQLPAKPAYLRVKVWRRLQALGAVSLKGAVAALPATEQTREDLQWVLREIADGGGEAMLCEARLLDGLTDLEAERLFSAARLADYEALAAEVRTLDKTLPAEPLNHWNGAAEVRAQITRFHKRLAQIRTIDFFGSEARPVTERLIGSLEAKLADPPIVAPPLTAVSLGALADRTWVTRAGVGVDRIACAWLIRRFVDPSATFKFVSNKAYAPLVSELRFDMLEAEFTHEGDRCSFETFLHRLEMDDPALKAISEIIHDMDLKDGKFGREETPGIARLIDGISLSHSADDQRISRGSALLDDLYTVFLRRP